MTEEQAIKVLLMIETHDELAFKAKEMAIEALKQKLCDDAISRKSLKHKLQEHHDFFVNAYGGFSNLPQNDKSRVDEITNCIAMVVNEPPIKPQEKTGHWIPVYIAEHPKEFVCNQCGYFINIANANLPFIDSPYEEYKFCTNCGAKMIESQESENKR